MSDGSSWIEIVLLAMLAAFIGLRLVSVLGKRTGHEPPVGPQVGDAFRPGAPERAIATSANIETRARDAVARGGQRGRQAHQTRETGVRDRHVSPLGFGHSAVRRLTWFRV